jgi:hypothetical protein
MRNSNMALKRGQKKCDGCGVIVGARTKQCKDCGHKFVIRKGRGTTGKKYQIADWKDLRKGDRIRHKQGSGPYFVDYDGERHYSTPRGTYQVMNLDLQGKGIVAWGPYGAEYLYMGPEKQSKHLKSYYNSPHRITYSKDHFSKRAK